MTNYCCVTILIYLRLREELEVDEVDDCSSVESDVTGDAVRTHLLFVLTYST